jgi:NAD(P)-dependent dehydrogenase (short-subunit alcohol dehydrogenase family)
MNSSSVIVTGGTGHLGRAVVQRFLDEGAQVVVPWISEGEVPALREAAAGAAHRLHLLQASVTDPDGVSAVIDTATSVAPLRAAVALVGGFGMSPLAGTSTEAWDRLVALNATSFFQTARQALPALAEAGGGSIVAVAAEPALERGSPGMGAYGATKAAVVHLTRTLAKEGADQGVTANAVAPRIIDTPPNRESMPDADTSTWITPEEIARVISFLCGEDGRVVTGNVMTLSRGS